MLLQPKKKVVSWGNSHDIRKAKLSAQANRQKYSGTSHSEKNHHNNNWQTQPQRRYKKMQEETGIFDKHGRRVRPKITIQLENHSPRITRSLPETETIESNILKSNSNRNRTTSTGSSSSRRNSLVDNIKGSLARDYRKSSAALEIDDRRCYKYIRMLKSGTPKATVVKLMTKAFGSEYFQAELLDNWQEKLIHANQPIIRKKRVRRTSKAAYIKRHMLGHFQADDGMSSVDRHELDQLTKHNNTIKLVVTYIIYLMQQQKGRAQDFFARLDTSGDGELSETEFSAGLATLGFTLQEDETHHLFEAIDDDASGEISIREFVKLLRQDLDTVKVTILELLNGLRRLEVVVSQEHCKAIHQYLINEHGNINVSELHDLIMSPDDLKSLNPDPQGLHPVDIAGRPKHTTYRFTNPLLSTINMDSAEMKAAKDRALLHKTVKRLENAYVASAFVLWRAKIIQDLHLNFKKGRSKSSKLNKGEKNVKINTRDAIKQQALLEMAQEDPEDQHHGGALANTTTMQSKIAALKAKRSKEKKQKEAVKRVQEMLEDPNGIARPEWNTSMMFPYRYKHLNGNEMPNLGKMFKHTAFWKSKAVGVPQRPKINPYQKKGPKRSGRNQVHMECNTGIASFTKHMTANSVEFRNHFNRPGIGRPTPELGGFYIPPSPRTEFPELDRFFEGGKAKELCRAFQRIEAPIGT